MGGEACAFELNCGVGDVEFAGGFFFDGGQELFAFIEVHVGDAGVQAQGIVIATERPDVDVVDFLNTFDF